MAETVPIDNARPATQAPTPTNGGPLPDDSVNGDKPGGLESQSGSTPKCKPAGGDLPYSKTVATLVALIFVIVAIIWYNSDGQAVIFKPFDATTFSGALTGLIAVALFIERAIEVLVAVVRDRQADDLQSAQDRAQSELDAATATWQAMPVSSVQPKRLAFEEVKQKQASLNAATANMTGYKSVTKEFAMKAALVIAALVSIVGVRSLQTLIEPGPQIRGSFVLADIIVTSLLLAGGSEGIHRIANVFTSFMDGASSRIDANTSAQQAASKK
jgi:hypothetical protein